MANFGWAYVNCSSASDGGAFGATGSIQFLTGAGNTTGSLNFMYYTGAVGEIAANTVVLTGTLVVKGIVSASHYHIADVTTIDSTGSTYFGNTVDDMYIRTGSLTVTAPTTFDYTLSASAITKRVHVRGFAGRYRKVTAATNTLQNDDYIIGCSASANQTIHLPTASAVGAGALLLIKDEYMQRAATAIYVSGAYSGSPMIEGSRYYILTGTMPAINLYSDGTNWLIF